MKWSIFHIREVRNIVISEFKSQPKIVRAYVETTSLEHSVEFHNELFHKEKASNINIIKLPPSKQVIIRNLDNKDIYFIFKSTTNKFMYELSEFYWIGVNPGNREERYKKLYLAYEELKANPDNVLRAIRHSLSHSRSSLNHKKTKEILINIFGDTKIDLKKYKHDKIFKTYLDKLIKVTSQLYLTKIINYIKPENKFEQFYIN